MSMLNDDQLEALYKANVGNSHFAGLRGVYDVGYCAALGNTNPAAAPDASASPTAQPPISVPVILLP